MEGGGDGGLVDDMRTLDGGMRVCSGGMREGCRVTGDGQLLGWLM